MVVVRRAVALFVDGGFGGDEVGRGGRGAAAGGDVDDFGGLGVVDWGGRGGGDVDEVVVVDWRGGVEGLLDGGGVDWSVLEGGGVDWSLDGRGGVDGLRGGGGGWGVDCFGVCFFDDFVDVFGFWEGWLVGLTWLMLVEWVGYGEEMGGGWRGATY